MQLMGFVVIEKDNHYLLVCESSAKWKGKWFFPGGHLNKGEDPVSAVIREAKEEAKCNVVLDGIFYFKFQKKFLNHKMHIYYHGRTDEPVVKANPDEHSLGSKWFTYEEITSLPLRDDALQILDIYRGLTTSLPIYNFNFIRKRTPYKIFQKDFNPF
jgi:ADP-ribose pyrophosphatase YjhB (NUDIX family)